jgi:hypothetical protein
MLKNIKIYESFISEDYKRSDIANLFGSPEDISLKQDFLRIKALLWLYKYQTEEEKQDFATHNLNGVGFTGPDAQILSSFAKQIVEKYFITEKQLQILRRKIKKYENQMAKIANAIQSGEAQKDPKIEAVAEEWKNRNMGRYSY